MRERRAGFAFVCALGCAVTAASAIGCSGAVSASESQGDGPATRDGKTSATSMKADAKTARGGTSTQAGTQPSADGQPSPTMSPATAPAASQGRSPEAAWLNQIGRGAAQTERVCMRAARDAVASALCSSTRPAIASLADLHSVLGVNDAQPPQQGQGNGDGNDDAAAGDQASTAPIRLSGMTAHSASLVSRFVSALNPRVVIGVVPGGANADARPMFALGFARGEPFVELVAYDFSARAVNFYLLAFEPSCANEHCTPAELLSESIESGWQGTTLYRAEDLANTPLDCLSCHQPEGASGPRRVLMRQLRNPWMHWMPLEPRGANCADADAGGNGMGRGRYVNPGLFQTFQQAHAGEARYAGLPLDAMNMLPAGAQLEAFVQTFEGVAGALRGQRGGMAGGGEPAEFPSREVLSESLCGSGHDAWSSYAAPLRSAGLPVPFYMPDVLEAGEREQAAKNYGAYLDAHKGSDEFELVSGWMSAEAQAAIGFQPSAGADATQVLREMCVRCHNDATDSMLTRSRFNAQSPERWDAAVAQKALERIALPADDPEHMPPRRFGELGAEGFDSLRAYLATRVAQP